MCVGAWADGQAGGQLVQYAMSAAAVNFVARADGWVCGQADGFGGITQQGGGWEHVVNGGPHEVELCAVPPLEN